MNEKKVSYFSDYNYNDLIFNYERSNNRGNSVKYYTKQIITLDTETTKYTDDILFVVDWSITIQNNITVYGHRIQDLVYTLKQILNQAIVNDNIICPVYIHNLSYDYMFLRNHLFNTFGKPINSLATKTHKYIFLKFENGLELRDSYILTQKSLEKLAKDMNVTNKAIGTYDYDKFRTPLSDRSEEEINYFVTDTISLNESLVKFFEQREVTNATTQYTSTGFIREKGYQYMYRDFREWNKKGFREQRLSLEHYKILLDCYHGGYTHANRYFIDTVLNDIICYDITSSYPSVICYEKFPMSKFAECDNIEYSTILKTCEDFAYCGYLEVINCRVKKLFPMPTIQQHKVLFERNALYDNGKLITADMVIFPFSDPDLFSFELAYDYDIVKVGKCIFTKKDFLPDFLTRSLIGELFYNKCTLKGIDDTNYMISKTYINGVYGMMVQKIIPDECTENFDTGEWKVDSVLKDKEKAEKTLDKFYKHHKKYLEYQWGVYVTAYAQKQLFKLGLCVGNNEWLYSDTDSVKATGFDEALLKQFNNEIIEKSKKRSLGNIKYGGKKYILGYADFDGHYDEFITLGSKRYCYRENKKLHITVAGVPKNAACELGDDIHNFKSDFIFCKKGGYQNIKYPDNLKEIEKLTAVYIFNDGIKTVEINGEVIEYGCAVRLDRVEYNLDSVVPYDKETGLPLNFQINQILEEE